MKRLAALTSTFTDVLAPYAKLKHIFRRLSANLPKQIARAACGGARAVALLSITGFAIFVSSEAEAINFTSSKELVKYVAQNQLSDKQYHCHNEIVYRESRWNDKAIGNIGGKKQAHGLYQMKIASLQGAHPELQFWKYWVYVLHRYGVTPLDEPDYCVALAHLKNKGWQ
jgi:hypothetical protein